jgi:hypothetical protein
MAQQSYTARYARQVLQAIGPSGYQKYVDEHGGAEFTMLWQMAHFGVGQGSRTPIPFGLKLGQGVLRREELERITLAEQQQFFRDGGRVVD